MGSPYDYITTEYTPVSDTCPLCGVTHYDGLLHVCKDEPEPTKPNPFDIQHGGDHYKNKGIQPLEYIMANDLSFCQGNVVKYVTRYKDKNGLEDLRKAKHYVEFLIAEMEQSDGNN
jgi:hypothetical protein